MAAARYWRIVSLDSYNGASLQLSEFGLFDGATRRDTGAVITSTVAPAAGSLSALNDGGFDTSVTFNAAQFRLPGFAIEWDLGSSLEVNVVRLATVSNATAPMVFTIQYQDGAGQWVTERLVRGAKPSNGALGSDVILVVADEFFQNVSLLLHLDGPNGSTTFTDSSPSPKTVITVSGNAQISTAQSLFGGASALFDGNDSIEVATDAAFGFGTGDFCIEFFIRFSDAVLRYPFALSVVSQASFLWLTWNPTRRLSFRAGGPSDGPASPEIALDQWVHVACSRQGSTFRSFLNGVQWDSVTFGNDLLATRSIGIGGLNSVGGASTLHNGFIDEVRVTKGVARYTANFTPPAAPFPDGAGAENPSSGDPIPLRTSPTASPRSISYYRVPDPTTFSTRAPLSFDQEDAGRFRIVGTVKEVAVPSNAPLRRRVLLIDEVSRRTIRETWSDATTGVYVFNQIAGAPRRYTVVSYDHTGQYRAVIADNLEAEPMT